MPLAVPHLKGTYMPGCCRGPRVKGLLPSSTRSTAHAAGTDGSRELGGTPGPASEEPSAWLGGPRTCLELLAFLNRRWRTRGQDGMGPGGTESPYCLRSHHGEGTVDYVQLRA